MLLEAGNERAAAHRRMLLLTWGISALYLLVYMRFGWIPHDEGTIGQSAERVLLGELPHRDFADTYTGGLTFLHALAFRIFGLNLMVPRYVLLAAALVWVPTVYRIAGRFVSPVVAAAATLCAVAWSLPNFFVAMPSWYNLFFATFFAAALLKHAESRRLRWLGLAGAFAGLSMLVKITGIYLLAVGWLYVLYLEADTPAASEDARASGSFLYPLLSSAAVVAVVAVVLFVLLWRPSAAQVVHFFVPSAAAAAYIVWLEWRTRERLPWRARVPSVVRCSLALGGGAALPMALFSVPFLLAGAFGDLMHGVFVLPAERLTLASAPLPSLGYSMLGLLFIAATMAVLDRVRSAVAAAVVALLVLLPAADLAWHTLIIIAARLSVPVLVAAAALLLTLRKRDGAAPAIRQQQVTVLMLVLSLSTLIQFPFSGSIYFLYVAPLVVLTAVGVYSLWAKPPRLAPPALLAVSLVFALFWMNHLSPYSRGLYFVPGANTTELALSRAGGLRIPADDAAMHERVAELLSTHSGGEYTYAGPDAPHLYFLTGLRNPTRYLFEFFSDPAVLEYNLLGAMDSLAITAIAVNRAPQFTPPFSSDFLSEIASRFPESEVVGVYAVRWRD